MGWRRDEVWLSTELLWFREQASAPAAALSLPGLGAFAPGGAMDVVIPSGLAASRQRRAARRQQQRSRKARAAALVIGSTAVIPLAAHRVGSGTDTSRALAEDPPSLTVRKGPNGIELAAASIPDRPPAAGTRRRTRKLATVATPEIDWNQASSRGLPYAGSLAGGTQLPLEGPDWVTWHPAEDRIPNAANRLYGHERTIRAIVSVMTAYRSAHPEAARVVVGDISFRGGGSMDQHVSHQNGLDVDVYYPRRDRALRAPVTAAQVDRSLAQDLLDRFVAAGAQKVFVGYSTGLRGPGDVVVPYPNHEDHLHVRFPAPPA